MAYRIFAALRSESLTWYDIHNMSDTGLILHSENPVVGDSFANPFRGYNSAVYINSPDTSVSTMMFFLIFDNPTQINWYGGGSHTSYAVDNGDGKYGLNQSVNSTARNVIGTEIYEGLPLFRDYNEWLNYVQTPFHPPYNWQSVPSISGKNGILSLSRVLDDRLLTGDSIARIELSDMSESIPARFAVLQQNLPNGVPTPVIYAGLVDNLTITMKHDGYTNLYAFNLNVNTIYSIEGNLSANSLGFIIDNDNEVAKVVYYTAVREAGIVTYFSMTVPTQSETEMHNLWLWLFTHMNPEDEKIMFGKQEEVLESYGIRRES